MRRHFVVLAVVVVAALVASVAAQPGADAERFWPQWRGPHATGASRTANPPTEWSETRNVRWKVEIPGRGSGSPVVWGNRLFLLSAVPMGVEGAASHEPRSQIQPRDIHRFIVLAIDRPTGRVVWERTAREERPRQPAMKDGTWASSSAVTDGQRVYAFFESSGLYTYDMAGNLLWQKHLGEKKMFADVGESGSTPCSVRQPSCDRVGPSRRVLCRRARRPDRSGALARRSPGSRFVEHASRGGARRALSSRDDRAEPHQKLRPRDGQGCVGERGA
jgi:hypothetical protein